MLIRKVKLSNIRSYGEREIIFPEGSVLLSGDIGSGKSSILLSVDFALFGLRKGEISGGSLLRHGKNEGFVEAVFDIDGDEITIRRTLKRKKDSIAQDSGFIAINGVKKGLTPTELRAFMLERLGYPKDLITRNKSLIYRYTVYTPQEEMKRILTAGSDERLDVIRKVFGIDSYRQMQENCSIVSKDLRERCRELKGISSGLEILEAEQKASADELLKCETENAGLKAKAEELAAALKESEREFEKASASLKELNEIKSLSAEKRSQISLLGPMVESEKRRLAEIEAELSKIVFEAPGKEESGPNELRKEISEKRLEKSEAEKNISALSVRIDSLNSILRAGVCGTCEQKVSDVSKFGGAITEKESLRTALRKKCERLNAEIIALEKRIEESSKSLLVIQKKESLQKRLGELKESVENKTNELSKAELEYSALGKKAEPLLKCEEEMFAAKRILDSARACEREAVSKLSASVQKLADLKRVSERRVSEISEKRKARLDMEKSDRMRSWLEDRFVPLACEMERHIMNALRAEFGSLFSEWFRMLIDDETLNVRLDDSFTPVIEQNGYETDYQNLSGGEKTAAALAYRLALNKVINSLIEKIRTKDLIILDEPTDGFSSEQLDKVRDVLRELKAKQTIIVSHDPKIESFVDHVIRLHKEGHVTRVVD